MIAHGQRLGVTVLTAVVLVGCGGSRAQAPAPQPSPTSVRATVSRLGIVRPKVIVAGLIAPHQNVALSASLSEPARIVNVREGEHVSRGEVLAVLATDDLRASLDAAQRSAPPRPIARARSSRPIKRSTRSRVGSTPSLPIGPPSGRRKRVAPTTKTTSIAMTRCRHAVSFRNSNSMPSARKSPPTNRRCAQLRRRCRLRSTTCA